LLALIDRAERRCIASGDAADFNTRVAAAQKSFIKDIKAFLHTGAKYSLRQRPKGNNFYLLQV